MIGTAYEVVISELTGRQIIINRDPANHLVPPSWSPLKMEAALAEFLAIWEPWASRSSQSPQTRYWASRARRAVEPLGEAKTREAFATCFETFMNEVNWANTTQNGGCKRLWRHARLAMWNQDCIVFPQGDYNTEIVPRMQRRGPRLPQFLQHIVGLPLVAAIIDYASKNGQDGENLASWLLCMITSMQGVREFGDLTPETLPMLVDPNIKPHWRRAHKALRKGIVALQEQEGHRRYVAAELRPKQPRRNRLDLALRNDSGLHVWATEANEWIETVATSKGVARVGVGRFLEYLAENKHLPRSPIEYLSRRVPPAPRFEPKATPDREVIKFLEYLLHKHCSVEDEQGLPYINPAFENPLANFSISKNRRAETYRLPMPTRIVHACINVLSENNFEWARQWDNVRRLNTATGEVEDVWWPGRAIVLMVKLLTPARTAQVRWLDSGEADSFIYNPGEGWKLNTGRLAPKLTRQPVEKGVFRKYRRLDGEEGSVLYFNTNKTRDLPKIGEYGFVMPWENERVIGLLALMRDWQIKFNPIPAPLPWTEVRESADKFVDARLRQMGSACFLFRDPVNEEYGRWRPVTSHRVRGLWLELQAEVERRLLAAGEKVKLVETWTEDSIPRPQSPVFDLHSLRVTMITALYKAGVPAEVLMRVVGHASVIMTLYYTKFHPEEITQQIAQAQQKTQTAWVDSLRSEPPEALSQAIACSHPSAWSAFANGSPSGVVFMDHGICPVGMGRCHEGLVIEESNKKDIFTAVPGGASNCTRCRFFITGVPFLIGLVAHVNDLSYRARRLSEDFTDIKDKLERLENEQMQAAERGVHFDSHHKVQLAATGCDAAMARVDEALLSLADAVKLAKQCEALAQADTGDGYSLVAAGGYDTVSLVMHEAHELEQLQRICASSTVFEGLRIDWREANLRRARYFDRMLRDSNEDPIFMDLDEALAKRVGDEFGKLLLSRLGSRDISAVAVGTLTLERLGISKLLAGKLSEMKQEIAHSATSLIEDAAGPSRRIL